MILEEGLYRRLKEITINGKRVNVYAGLMGDQIPAIVYTAFCNPFPDQTLAVENNKQIQEKRFQIDCYEIDYMAAKKLSGKVIKSLNNLRGDLGYFPIQWCFCLGCRDGFDDGSNLYREMLTFIIYY